MDITINNMPFCAKLGKNILKQINREFNNDKTRVDRYVRLFEDTFSQNIDRETVIDINKNRNFIFSNNHFPNVKYQQSSKMKTTVNFAQTLLNECSRTFGYGENILFETIISKYLNNNVNFKQLKQLADRIPNSKSKETFLEKIKFAMRIKKEFPNTNFSKDEFNYIKNVIMQEEAETPGTKLYEQIHNFLESDLTFSL